MQHADTKFKEELGSVIINEIEVTLAQTYPPHICMITLPRKTKNCSGLTLDGLTPAGWILAGFLAVMLLRMLKCLP